MGVEVRVYAGLPGVALFASAIGSPIVIDSTTAIPYYLAPGDIVTAIGGASTGTGITLGQVEALLILPLQL